MSSLSAFFWTEKDRLHGTQACPIDPCRGNGSFSRADHRKRVRNGEQFAKPRTVTGTYLTGLIHYGHCGAKMYGTKKTRRKKGKTYQYEKQICSTYQTQEKYVYDHHSIEQHRLLWKLRDSVISGGQRETLRDRVKE